MSEIEHASDTAVPGSGIAIRMFVESAKLGLPWLQARFLGKRILIVGPRSAGKTSIADYLSFGQLFAEGQRDSSSGVERRVTYKVTL